MAAFTVDAREGEARTGALTTPSGAISTPAMLLCTRRGGALNLTPDLLDRLKPEAAGVQLNVLSFLSQPKPEVLRGCPGGARRHLALDAGWVLVAGARDPVAYEYTGPLRKATNEWASVSTHNGSVTVTPAQYMEAVAALQPDVWVALSDEVPSDAKHTRAAAATERTPAWLRACLEAAAAAPTMQRAAAFAAVQGGQHLGERELCADAVAAVPGVVGYAVGGLGTGESPQLRGDILAAVLPRLPPAAPRLLGGLGCPEEVLEAVAQGIDLFETAYVAQVTAAGMALSFPLTPEDDSSQGGASASNGAAAAAAAAAASGSENGGSGGSGGPASSSGRGGGGGSSSEGGDDTKLNLWALAHRTDRSPLLPGCSCVACANHTRAYIHHLLEAHEMTAQVLLELHNTHHYLQFFAAIRRSIAAGRFAAYRDWFLRRRERLLLG